ncbi:MAG: 50S ribosomal protein L15 [Microcella sp.]|nr:50S ribosomal protein L15 [Microcella sp.]UYN83315.1 MAG: 50S ribosomal protein L15 [Microcella sp.]
MAEEKKPAADKAPAKKPAAAKPAAEKKPAAKKPAASKTAADSAPAKKAPAAKADSADKPAAKKPAASKPAAAKAPVTKAAAAKAPAATADSSDKATATKAPAKKAPTKKAPAADVARPQVLKVHHLRPAPGSKKERTRVGRGEGSKGKTAGRGTKGTKARYQVKPGFEGGNLNSVMRAPKLRGFTNPFRVEYQVVNLAALAALYPKGGDVTIADLVSKGAVRKNEKVKVLGDGEIAVKLNVTVDKVSRSAEQKIVAAGGSIQ